MRILSLLPSATEIVYALGRGDQLVGRSAECDFPLEARRLPVVMEAKESPAERPSGEIDASVRATRGRGESLYRLNLELLTSLRPELILTQDLCSVCSVTPAEVVAACGTVGLAPEIVALTPRNLEEVWASVERIGAAIGARSRADDLAAELRRRSRSSDGPPDDAPRVAVVEWLDPPILAGLWTPDIVRRAGANYIGPHPASVGARTTWAELLGLGPDLLIVSPCSFTVERTTEEMGRLRLGGFFADAPIPLGVWVADEAYFSRPGPRLADGVELVRALVGQHPPSATLPVRRWPGAIAEATA
ncbi:MAG: cobalamin-binding protein [Thermoplasmata archaeon]|nr:cobalamin-binding protein [Thermoplasmata archaeon]